LESVDAGFLTLKHTNETVKLLVSITATYYIGGDRQQFTLLCEALKCSDGK